MVADAGEGVRLVPLERAVTPDGLSYRHVSATFDRAARRVDLTVRGPRNAPPDGAAGILAEGADYWPLAVARELDLDRSHLELPTAPADPERLAALAEQYGLDSPVARLTAALARD